MDEVSTVAGPVTASSSPSLENENKLELPNLVPTQQTTANVPSQSASAESKWNRVPSIDMLGDLVSRSEAREKYLAQTISPSDGEDVRWYFGKVPLAPDVAAASVPATEVVGRNDYLRFSMRDSLALEAAFLEQEEELFSTWWKEYAECSDGPTGDAGRESVISSSDNVRITDGSRSLSSASGSGLEQFGGCQYSEDKDDIIGVPVKGGLYEVDLWTRRCFPVYWRGEQSRVLRGHWFARKGGIDWLPLREDVSEQLEFAYRSQIWHRRTFQPSGQFAARVDLQGATQGLHALFTGEDDTWEAWLHVDVTGISMVLCMGGSGIKLRRGFAPPQSSQLTQNELQQRKEEEMDDYCSQVPVRHLVFMVHGIGQRLQNANLVDDVGTFRQIAASLAEQHLTPHQRNAQRVLFIPCQWRRGLKLKGEDAVENCTLEGVRALRTMLSATVLDVLYYMSPVYCQDIMDSVSEQLNRLYQKFVKRNPGYDGKVSIYGHSLGSVLSYDILCHQDTFRSTVPVQQIISNLCQSDKGDASEDEVSEGGVDVDLVLGHSDGQPNVEDKTAATVLHATDISHNGDSNTIGSDLQEVAALKSEVNALKTKLRVLKEGIRRSNCEGLPQQGFDHFSLLGQSQETSQNEMAITDTVDSTERDLTPQAGGIHLEGNESKLSDSEVGEHRRAAVRQRAEDLARQPAPYLTAGEKVRVNVTAKVNSRKRHTPHVTFTKLVFEVDTFFAVGSPVGVFLALRNVRLGIGAGKEYWRDDVIEEEMPACKKMLNIFHPYDPVAYRIEPLVCKEYVNRPPVFVPYHKGGKRLHIAMQEFGEGLSARSKAFFKSFGTVRTRMVGVFSASLDDRKAVQDIEQIRKERSYGSIVMERLTGDPEGRIDYMLQDATFEHQYIQAVSAHTSYWRDLDTALFIIKQLYHGIPLEPPISKPPEPPISKMLEIGSEITVSSNLDPNPLNLSDLNNFCEEEGTFTFSSKEEVVAIMSSMGQATPSSSAGG